jgi:hypothetical protein
MDTPPFGLSQSRRQLLEAGIRYVLLDEPPAAAPTPYTLEEPWVGFLRLAPSSPKLVWTYLELGQDLAGRADQRRSECWRKLIARLGWPRGTVAFWPYALYREGTHRPDRDAFLAGLKRLDPSGLVVFGAKPLLDCLGDADQLSTLGPRTHLAPTPEQLLGGADNFLDNLAQDLRRFYELLS